MTTITAPTALVDHRRPFVEATATEAGDPYCLGPGEVGVLLADAPWRRLAVIGDSIAEGVGDPVPGYLDLSWADRFALSLGSIHGRVSYANGGSRGARAGRIRREQLDAALATGPDLAFVIAGANDMLGRRFDPDSVAAELDTMVGAFRVIGADVVTFGLFDLSRAPFVPDALRPGLRDGISRLGAVTASIAERHGAVHVDFSRHPASGDLSIWSADHLHANRRGHAIIHTQVVRALAGRIP
jgi:lysophospholipase L1-like esterase